MAADLVPIRLALTAGDRYTLWAPRWRDAGDEWEAFLGKDEDLYAFPTVADLVAYVRTCTDNDLVDHPGWPHLVEAVTDNAHKLTPAADRNYDLITVEALIADKPTKKSVRSVADAMEIVSSIGAVCDLATATKFFNGNPSLGTLAGGVDNFAGRAGRKRWHAIAEIISRSWSSVLTAVEDVISTPDVDAAAVARAAEELKKDPPAEPETESDSHTDTAEPEASATDTAAQTEQRAAGDRVILGDDADFWSRVGIDPIRIMTDNGTFFSLRCYLGETPVFLGRNGRISVFGSERALARYLADEHDHDLSDLATYDDIRTAANDGSLAIVTTDDNVYVLSGLVDDLAEGPDAVDREQLDLAVEFLRDVGTYAEDAVVSETLETERPLGALVAYVLAPESVPEPRRPFGAAVKEWERLEQFAQSRLRRE